MNFLTNLKTMLKNEYNTSITENGARGYRTFGKALVDLNFAVASLRSADEQEIINRFFQAYYEDRKTALIWLFYARDVRSGLGERRLFRVLMKYLAEHNDEIPMTVLMALIPEYGRFDDLLLFFKGKYEDQVTGLIKAQLAADLEKMEQEASISLLAKWLPSINASNSETKALGKRIAKKLNMSEREYRKTLSKLRSYLDIVERKMSADQFVEINYAAVPSKANLIYKRAFLRHDEERRLAYLESLAKGETKINAGVLFPHEIVHSYVNGYRLKDYDETLEQLWQALPNTVGENSQTIVVADGSGSMMVPVGNGSCSALSVANALAIYFAERSHGPYQNHYITFSNNPKLVDLSKGKTLREKLQIASLHNEVANTDIYKVFRLILDTAVRSHSTQAELPENIVIISDMEFDRCTVNADAKLFEQIHKEYRNYGYQLPRLIFWNVNSRTNTIPVIENALGVALVSGFSVNIVKMVMSGEADPYQCLLEILNSERYDPVRTALTDMAAENLIRP